MSQISGHGVDDLDADERALIKVLLHNNRITQEQVNGFLAYRMKFESEGRRYLGDILVQRGYVTKEMVDTFFSENNRTYLDFLRRLMETGFMRKEQYDTVMADEQALVNVVTVVEKLGVMTKENFTKMFAKSVNSLRLGDWLLAKRQIGPEHLREALAEQRIYRFEDYAVYHGIVSRELLTIIKEKIDTAP